MIGNDVSCSDSARWHPTCQPTLYPLFGGLFFLFVHVHTDLYASYVLYMYFGYDVSNSCAIYMGIKTYGHMGGGVSLRFDFLVILVVPSKIQSEIQHLIPHPVLLGPCGPRSDVNRHCTGMESDQQNSFRIILTNTEYY